MCSELESNHFGEATLFEQLEAFRRTELQHQKSYRDLAKNAAD